MLLLKNKAKKYYESIELLEGQGQGEAQVAQIFFIIYGNDMSE